MVSFLKEITDYGLENILSFYNPHYSYYNNNGHIAVFKRLSHNGVDLKCAKPIPYIRTVKTLVSWELLPYTLSPLGYESVMWSFKDTCSYLDVLLGTVLAGLFCPCNCPSGRGKKNK